MFQCLTEPLDLTSCLQKYRGWKNKLKGTSMKDSAKSRMWDTFQRNDLFSLTKPWHGLEGRGKVECHKIKVNIKDITTYSECAICLNLDSILSNVKWHLLRQSGKKKCGLTFHCVDELLLIFVMYNHSMVYMYKCREMSI